MALPIRVTYWCEGVRRGVHSACTYDIGAHSARVIGLRDGCRVGDLLSVERGRNKALFRVGWVGEAELRGQFRIDCVEESKVPWALELEESEEKYEAISRPCPSRDRPHADKRRRTPRFVIEDAAGILSPSRGTALEAQVQNLSECGCQVAIPVLVTPGSEVEILLVSNLPITLRGKIRHAARNLVSGIEFECIRRGDRPLLRTLLRKLQQQSREDSAWNLEVIEVSS